MTLAFYPEIIPINEPTTIAILGSVVSEGDTLVFLPAGTAGCLAAASYQDTQGAVVRQSVQGLVITIALFSPLTHKVCHAVLPSPMLDSDYNYIPASSLRVRFPFQISPPPPPEAPPPPAPPSTPPSIPPPSVPPAPDHSISIGYSPSGDVVMTCNTSETQIRGISQVLCTIPSAYNQT